MKKGQTPSEMNYKNSMLYGYLFYDNVSSPINYQANIIKEIDLKM